MIGLPFNDHKCLGSITEILAELVATEDPLIVELARKHPTTESLARYIRSLPQRDDDGDPKDGPKVETCEPPQRLRIPAENPNCLERSCLFIAVAEFIDPLPTRQLATLDMPMGLHTFPLENGAPVILDPSVPRNCLDCGLALASTGMVAIEPRDAIDWTSMLAEQDSANVRNGPSRVRRARNAVMRLVDDHVPPTQGEVDAIGWMFALAERAAKRWGSRALAMVRTTALAIAEIAEEVIARTQRNLSLEVGGMRFEPPRWMSQLGGRSDRARRRRGGDPLQARHARRRRRHGRTRGAGAEPRGTLDGCPRAPAQADDVRDDAAEARHVETQRDSFLVRDAHGA